MRGGTVGEKVCKASEQGKHRKKTHAQSFFEDNGRALEEGEELPRSGGGSKDREGWRGDRRVEGGKGGKSFVRSDDVIDEGVELVAEGGELGDAAAVGHGVAGGDRGWSE
jgi:hypothetical protein